MDTFVNISTSFFVENRLVTVGTCCETRKMHLFIFCFREFYNRSGWLRFNEDFPLAFQFSFCSLPDRFVNFVTFSGIKPDIKIITFSKYMNNVLSKKVNL